MTRGILLFCAVMIGIIGCLCVAIVFIAATSWTEKKERTTATEVVPTYEFRDFRRGLVSKSGKFTFLDKDVCPPGMPDGLIVYHDSPYSVSGGVVDASGKRTHLHWQISEHTRFVNGMAPAQALELKDGSYPFFYIDRNGRKVIKTPFYRAEPFSEGRAAVVPMSEATRKARKSDSSNRNEWWGYIDTVGKTVIAPSYSEAGPFSAGRAIVKRVRPTFETSVIDSDGKTILNAEQLEVKPYSKDGFAVFSQLVSKHKSAFPRYGLLDVDGKVHSSTVCFLNFSEGLGLVSGSNDVRFATADGKMIFQASKERFKMPFKNVDRMIMSEGLAAVPIKEYRMKDLSYRGYPIQKYEVAYGFIDKSGKPLSINLPEGRVILTSYPFSNGYSVVQTAIPVEKMDTVSKSPGNKTK